MTTFFIYEFNNKFEMYQMGLSKWIDIVKTSTKYKFVYLLGAALLCLAIFAPCYIDIVPEYVKGIIILIELLGAIFVIPTILSDDNIIVDNRDSEPQRVIDSKALYFLKYCGRVTDTMSLFDIYYVQWEDGAGIIIDTSYELINDYKTLKPMNIAKEKRDVTLVVSGNKVREEYPFNIVNSERIVEIVNDSGIIDKVFASSITKEKIGRKLLENIMKGY